LWNPSINLKSNSSTILCFRHKRILYCGFGYDRVHDRYKVLVVVQNKSNSKEIKTIIYIFGENSWTNLQNFLCGRDSYRELGKFVSGSLNWIVNKHCLNSTNQKVIISFDLEKETYREMLMPQHQHYGAIVYFSVSSNCICVSFYDYSGPLVVWMMKEYGVVESWTKLMTITLDNKFIHTSFFHASMSDAFFISENGVHLLRNKNKSELIVYNLNDNGGLDYCSSIFGTFGHGLHVYHESL
jgi:F-box interacting protein